MKDEIRNAFCPYCGRELFGDEQFCPSCGKKLVTSSVEQKEIGMSAEAENKIMAEENISHENADMDIKKPAFLTNSEEIRNGANKEVTQAENPVVPVEEDADETGTSLEETKTDENGDAVYGITPETAVNNTEATPINSSEAEKAQNESSEGSVNASLEELAEIAKKNKEIKKKRILIGSSIAAVTLILLIIIISIVANDSIKGDFKKETAIQYDCYGLACYAPKDWLSYDDDPTFGAAYYGKNSKEEGLVAFVDSVYIGEFDDFDSVIEVAQKGWGIKYNQRIEETFNSVSIVGCKEAMRATLESDTQKFLQYIVLCDRSGFIITGCANNDYFDEEEFDKIILATDFASYDGKNICEYLDGHEVEEWEVATASTCTKKGKEKGMCATCLQTVTRDLPYAEHTVDDWEVKTEATCEEKGEKHGICTVCDQDITEEIPLAEHTPGEWIVTKEATETKVGERHQKCTVCGKILNSGEYTMTLDEIKATYRTDISYSKLERSPDDYEGEKVKFSGKVLQVQESDYGSVIRMATKGSYDNVLYVTFYGDTDTRIVEDDKITVYGTSTGIHTYTAVMGNSISIPSVYATYIDQ